MWLGRRCRMTLIKQHETFNAIQCRIFPFFLFAHIQCVRQARGKSRKGIDDHHFVDNKKGRDSIWIPSFHGTSYTDGHH